MEKRNGLVLTISRKPKTSCFPLFTGNIIRLENKKNFNIYLEKYVKVEENPYLDKFEMYIEKRLLFEEGNDYRSTIDVEIFEEEGEIYGNLIEEFILINT
ncbi:MAG: hypothetical protein ACFFE5_14615 [Candidatus Thorarchaeota archaeon]